MGAAHHAFGGLGAVGCPVVVARGAEVPMAPSSFAGAIAAALPHGRLEPYEDLGHFGPMEAPERIAGAIERSLAT
jgi:pimeloyl-ACP methyl ester carboxylesterase